MRTHTTTSRARLWLALAALAACCGGSCGTDPEADGVGAELHGSLAGKNLLVTMIDACAAEHLELYGYERDTMPYLTQLAESGLVFEDVTAPAPYTIASVASLMTGEAVDLHGVISAGQQPSAELSMLAERFRAAGYRTEALSANAHIQERFGFGRGFESFRGFWPKLDEHHRVPAAQAAAASAFLESAAEDQRPFFAYWHFLPPHAPYDPPAPQRASFAGHLAGPLAEAGSLDNLTPLSHGARQPAEPERQAIEDLYDASLRHVDATLAAIGADLERLGLAEDTLWVIVSDHGEAFGEHGVWQHARTVYEEMVRVPLVLALPASAPAELAEQAGTRIADPVGLGDLNPTLLDLFGLEGPRPWSSSSLLATLAGGPRPATAPPVVTRTAGPGEHVAIRVGDLKLIHRLQPPRGGKPQSGPGTWELYDLAADPGETSALAVAPEAEHNARYRELRRALRQFRSAARERARAASEVEIDAATDAALGDIGYFGEGAAAPEQR